MDRTTLRATQDPLKVRYRDDPGAAIVTLRADGRLGEGISCSVQSGRAMADAGLHPATGGDGTELCGMRGLIASAGARNPRTDANAAPVAQRHAAAVRLSFRRVPAGSATCPRFSPSRVSCCSTR